MTPAEDFCSMWQWLSIAPGNTSRPVASMSRAPAARPWPSATIVPFRTPISPLVVSAGGGGGPRGAAGRDRAVADHQIELGHACFLFRSAVIASRAAAKQSPSADTMLMEIA